MKKQIFKFLFLSIILCFFGSNSSFAQSKACCSKDKTASAACNKNSKAKTACCATAPKETTSGCTPSNCRGSKTKFGEAKVISDLRLQLFGLKAAMEKSEDTKFSERSYSVHGIIGETDSESLNIIADEVKVIETAFENAKIAFQNTDAETPESSAKLVRHLSSRITYLNSLL